MPNLAPAFVTITPNYMMPELLLPSLTTIRTGRRQGRGLWR